MSVDRVSSDRKVAAWVVMRSRRRSTESASRPPTIPSTNMGIIPKKPTRPTSQGESVSTRTNHPSRVICIHLEAYAMKLAGHRKR